MMLGYALRTVRARAAGFVGSFLALFCAAAMVAACGALLETGLRGSIETERYAATPIIVTGDQNVHQVQVTEKEGKADKVKHKSKPVFERVWLPVNTVEQIEAVPGVQAAVAEVHFPAHLVGTDGELLDGPGGAPSWGHSWDSAALTPFTITEGAPPSQTEEIVIGAELAGRAGTEVGDLVTVQATQAPTEYRVAGIAAPGGGALTQQSSIFFSPEEAQRLSGRIDQVAVVGVFPAAGVDPGELGEELVTVLDVSAAEVHTGADRGAVEFLDAAGAKVQLISIAGAMSGTAILVAILVVVGTFALSIQQRYRELALLRAAAATPKQIRQLIGREALIIGLLAALPGAAAGWLLADWLRSMFIQLGALPETLELVLSPFPAAAAVVLTMAGAWAAARVSARRASRIQPSEALTESVVPARLIAPGRLIAGTLVLVAGLVLAAVLSTLRTEPASGPVTFLTVVVLSTAAALLGPVLTRAAVALVGLPLRLFRVGGHLAAANARAKSGRVAAVLSPLTLMVAMACTVVFMQTTMAGAAQEQAAAGQSADLVLVSSGPGVPEAAAGQLHDIDGVDSVAEIVHTDVRVGLDRYQVQGVSAAGRQSPLDLGVSSGSMDGLDGDWIALSEVTADSLGARVGDNLELTMGDGTPLSREVVAVYERGLAFGDITMDRDVVAAHVDNPLNSSVAVQVADGADPGEVVDVAAAYPGVQALDRDAADALRVEQHHANAEVNYLALGLVVAFAAIAVVNTLSMSTAERFREFALLRLVGGTRRQVLRMLRVETLLICLIAMTLGTGIAVGTLSAFSIGMTGTAAPHIVPLPYVSIVGAAALLALAATLIPGRMALSSRPEHVIGSRE